MKMGFLSFLVTLTVLVVPSQAKLNPAVSSLGEDSLNYDENQRTANNAVVYDATNNACDVYGLSKFQHPSFQVLGLEGEARDQVFGESNSDSCRAACISQGVPMELAPHVMPEHHYDSDTARTGQTFQRWFIDTCTRVEVCLLNYHSKTSLLEIMWQDPQTGKEQSHLKLEYGDQKTRCFYSFVGHKFVAYDTETNEQVGDLTVQFVTTMAFGVSPPSAQTKEGYNYQKEIEGTLRHEWTRHNWVKRTFSPLGFKKGNLPRDVFASMSAFYYNNAQNIVREEWKNKGVFVNWWETDVYFVQIPWNLKEVYQERLRRLVEEWAGVPVEQTVMYGLRQYTEGARLLTHVDRTPTHAVSLIVNVAQGNLAEDWPVEVQDHEDRLHEVIMQPGEIVYYESAKCLHARNRPMVGPKAYYVNMFTHYRPVGDDKWYERENAPETPEPLILDKELSDLCSVDDNNKVTCSDARLGESVSPTLFQAKGPDDLIRWWKDTSPPGSVNPEGKSEGEL